MPIKNTYFYEKMAGGRKRHFWKEDDGKASTMFSATDEADSVSLHMDARTQGMYAPEITVATAVRITYADTQKLRDHLTDILVDREIEKAQAIGTLPVLPAPEIGSEEPVVSFVYFECRECGEVSQPVRAEGDDKEYDWIFLHGKQHKNKFRYYKWSLTRNTGRQGRL